MTTTQRPPESDANATGFCLKRSAARLCATYRGEPADRVPMMAPIGWSPNGDIDSHEFGDWRDEATPPMMGPRRWDEWVVAYDSEIMRRIE